MSTAVNVVAYFVDVFDTVVFAVIKRALRILKIVIKAEAFILLKHIKKYYICCPHDNLLLIKNNQY